MDYDALARKYGGSPAPLAGDPLEELAKQYGGSMSPLAPPREVPEEPSGVLRQVADVPLGVAKGVTSGIRMLSDIFGADNPVSQALKSTEGYLNDLMSAQARNDQKEIARIMKEAEDKGVLDQVVAGVKAFATAPVDMLSQAAGTAIPVIAGGLAGTVAKVAPRVIGAGIGAGMGTGVVKGTIYEETKQALIEAGVSPEQAEARAELAQSYGGQNLDQILLGTALGGLTAVTGVEPAAVGALTRRILGKEAAEKAAETTAKEAAKSVTRRAVETGVKEATPEFLQAAQEQIASNIAQQREGLDVDALRGAVSAGTLEALAGAGLGAGVGAVTRPKAAEEKPAGEVETEAKQPTVTKYATVNRRGQGITVDVTENPDGTITAKSSEGTDFDLEPFLNRGMSVPEAVNAAFARKNAKLATEVTAEVEEEVTAEEPAPIPEIPATPPAIEPTAAPEPEAPAKAEAPVEPTEMPKPAATEVTPKPSKTLYHGTNATYELQDFDASGGMAFFGDTFDIGSRYAYGSGGQRQRLTNKEKYVVNSRDGVVYELGENNQWNPVGIAPEEGLISSESLLPLDKTYPSISQAEVEKLTDPDKGTGEVAVIPKTARVTETNFEDLNLLDITTPEGRDVIANLTPSTKVGVDLVGAAKFDQERSDDTALQLNTNFWGTTKRSQSVRNEIRKDIVEPLKKLGYDGIYFQDDQHKTYGLFDTKKVLDQASKKQAPKAKAAAAPKTVQISPEEQKQNALNALSLALNKPVPAFRAQHPNGRVTRVAPQPLSAPQKKLILQLFGDAIDLGLPASLLSKITAAGATRMSSGGAIAAKDGWLMLGKYWQTSSTTERITTLVHELGHAVDYKNEQNYHGISMSSSWTEANKELKAWYDREPNAKNPLAYPFSSTFKKSIPDPETESFPQAFALYFVDPVGLQKNAPAAYSAIQSIVERIQNESATTTKAGAGPATAAGVKVQPARPGEGAAVQPEAGAVEPGVGRAERVEDRTAEVTRISPMLGRKKPAAPKRSAAGQAAVDTVESLGRQQTPEPTLVEKANELFKKASQNPSLTKAATKKAVINFLDKLETKVFATDAALNNAIRRLIDDTTMSEQDKIGALLSISSNQAVHADALASLFIQYGSVNYNPDLYKYEAVNDENNFIELSKAIDEISKKHGLTKEEAERVGHTFFEARRLNGVMEYNERIDAEVFDARDKLQKAIDDGDANAEKVAEQELRKATKKYKYVHMDRDQIDAGLDLAKTIPELEKLADIWNGIRENAIKVLVDSGLWSQEEAEIMMANIDYVPFYREDQIEKDLGPKEIIRGLQVQAKEKKFKGSDKPVADIFDNMVRWTQYAVKRSVMNKLAQAKISAALEFDLATPVTEAKKGPNAVRVWENGEPQYYDMADPLFMESFAGLESVSLPIWKVFASMSNFLRQSVVLYPLFSVAQVPQDAFAAMFSSGLKTRFALTIPARAVKEFIQTLRGSSKTHQELKRMGAVGIKDFSAAIARNDAEVAAGLKKTPGIWAKVKDKLEHISMASDNAIRQAVYSASIDQGLTPAEAIEKAFAIINFRNRGSSPTIRMLGQVVPFFNAYLAAQHVAIKTISGVGISPSAREEALKTLAATTGTVMALSLIYAMAMDDDDDYINKPSVMRDRLFIIPGTGMSIPIRTDIFSMPKILTEHMYMLITDQGMTDSRKFRDSMKAALGNMILGPTPVPQAIKPAVEVMVNYNFFQGRPLIGTFQKGLDVERQFNDSTSELAKLFGQTGLVSPIAADHLFRGMFGSLGGLTIFLTNPILHSKPDVPRPELSLSEAMAALPGTSGFVSKPYETGLKNDFYVLRDEVAKAVNTFNDIKRRSPADIEEFLADEDNVSKLGMQKAVNNITQTLSRIRRQISVITNLPASEMSAAEKRKEINDLKDAEQEILRNIDIKELRKMANL